MLQCLLTGVEQPAVGWVGHPNAVSAVDKKFKSGFGCMVWELIAWMVPGSPTAADVLRQTVADLFG